MTRTLLTIVISGALINPAILGGTVTVNSQASQPPSQTDAKPITLLTGCVRQTRADTTTADAKGMIYTLEAQTEKLPTSPAPEGSGPLKVDGRYALSFDQSVDLSKHVNHYVEVRGRRMPTAATDNAAKAPTPPKPLPGAAKQMFHVTAVKMISAKCPQ